MAKVSITTVAPDDASSTFLTVPGLSFALHANTKDSYELASLLVALGGTNDTGVWKCYTTSTRGYGGDNPYETYPKSSDNGTTNWFYKKSGGQGSWPGSIFSNCTGYAYGRALHWLLYLQNSGVDVTEARRILNLCRGTPPVWADKDHAKEHLKSKESIRPGGFLIWEKNAAPGQGHVAFVESVKLSNKGEVQEVIISESNYHEYTTWSSAAGTACNTTNQGFSIVSKNVGSSNPVAFSSTWGTFLGFIDLGLFDSFDQTNQTVFSLYTKTDDSWHNISNMFTKLGGLWYPIAAAYYKLGGHWFPLQELIQNPPNTFPPGNNYVLGPYAPRVCTDGSNHTLPDSNWQKGTALSRNGRPLDAYRVPYVVQPVVKSDESVDFSLNPTKGNMLGYKALVINRTTNLAVEAVVGESGPYDNGWGEMSIYCLWKTGYPNHATGNSSPTSNADYEIQLLRDERGNYIKVDNSFWTRYPDRSITKLPPGK